MEIRTNDVVEALCNAVPPYLDTLKASSEVSKMYPVVDDFIEHGRLHWDCDGSVHMVSPLALLARSLHLSLQHLEDAGVVGWGEDAVVLGRSLGERAGQIIIDVLAAAEERSFTREEIFSLLEALLDDLYTHLTSLPTFDRGGS